MHVTINSKLVEEIQRLVNTKGSQLDFLTRVLSIGRCAAARRLNKKVPFSYSEAVIIAEALNISLDNLASANKCYVDLTFTDVELDILELSKLSLESYLQIYDRTKDVELASMMIACNIIPYSSVIRYDNLYKFYLFKKLFQKDIFSCAKTFSELVISSNHKVLRKKLEVRINSICDTTLVIDKHVIYTMVDDILYFKELNLLSASDLALLRTDLLDFLEDLEKTCKTGKNPQGNTISVYISDITLDASYVYIFTPDLTYSQIQLHSFNTMITRHKVFGELQKKWIESVKNYSTLISEAGGIERKKFFDKQRAYCLKIN